MVAVSLSELLKQKAEYHKQWPGDPGTMMPRGVFLAYRNLLAEIRRAAKRNQGVLPGMDMDPVPPEGQSELF